MFRPLLPLDALPSDALSDQQLEVNCDAMLKGLARLARRDRVWRNSIRASAFPK